MLTPEAMDARLDKAVTDLYEEIKSTAKEFNTRGDLNAGKCDGL